MWYFTLFTLFQERHATQFALIGHSTGCQQSVHYCKYGRPDLVARVVCVALQAPVSDREAESIQGGVDVWIAKAREMAAQV